MEFDLALGVLDSDDSIVEVDQVLFLHLLELQADFLCLEWIIITYGD
jgi:hypothetical protein